MEKIQIKNVDEFIERIKNKESVSRHIINLEFIWNIENSGKLSYADLSSTNLSSADLSSANLSFADLSIANLS
ncbi:MAG TPA: hypothetical protein DC057_13265, partial [Spirochaetia bacterium]|nr:hypothetical protein [Spirochaetia bacterium]